MLKITMIMCILGFYTAILYTTIKHRFYLQTLFSKESEFTTKSRFYRCVYTRVLPIYKEEYFGYNSIVLYKYDNYVLYPTNHFRVYGVIHPNSECLIIYKRNLVRSVICLKDIRYADIVLEDLRNNYKRILILIIGGVLLCQMYLWFMI